MNVLTFDSEVFDTFLYVYTHVDSCVSLNIMRHFLFPNLHFFTQQCHREPPPAMTTDAQQHFKWLLRILLHADIKTYSQPSMDGLLGCCWPFALKCPTAGDSPQTHTCLDILLPPRLPESHSVQPCGEQVLSRCLGNNPYEQLCALILSSP